MSKLATPQKIHCAVDRPRSYTFPGSTIRVYSRMNGLKVQNFPLLLSSQSPGWVNRVEGEHPIRRRTKTCQGSVCWSENLPPSTFSELSNLWLYYLFLFPDLDEHLVDLQLPVVLEVVEVVVGHLVEVGVGDVVQQLQHLLEGGALVGVVLPAG